MKTCRTYFFYCVNNGPTSNRVRVDFELKEAGVVEITVTDRLGRTVRSEEETYGFGRNQHELDLSRLPNGVYMIGVSSEGDIQRKAILNND